MEKYKDGSGSKGQLNIKIGPVGRTTLFLHEFLTTEFGMCAL